MAFSPVLYNFREALYANSVTLGWDLAFSVPTHPSGDAGVCRSLRTSVLEQVHDNIVVISKIGKHLNVLLYGIFKVNYDTFIQ